MKLGSNQRLASGYLSAASSEQPSELLAQASGRLSQPFIRFLLTILTAKTV
jgi:hypothetical protein